MGFYKDIGGLILFFICHIVFILQFFFIYNLSDNIEDNQNIFLIVHKSINYILLFITIYSHIKTAIIDPGSIIMKNNKEIIEFYYFIHEPLIKRAIYITEKRTPEVVKNIILGQTEKYKEANKNKEDEKEEEEDYDNMSEKDDYNFEPLTSINDSMKKVIEEKYHMKTTRCINCFVIRPINAHHCTVCHKCILDQDHHCPWVNNCIGLYNKKIFILFLCYGFLESFYSDILFFYYTLYKNINKWSNSPKLIILDILAIIFGLILIIVSIMLLWDQYDTIVNECTQCDFKRGILLEKSSVKQQFQIIFGGIFNFRWLLPFFPGGNSDFFNQLSNFLKNRNLMKKKNNMKNNDNKQNNANDKIKNE